MELELVAGFSKHAAINFGTVGNVVRRAGWTIGNAPTATWNGVKALPGWAASTARGAGEAAGQPIRELATRPGGFLKERARHLALRDMPEGFGPKASRVLETAAFTGFTVPSVVADARNKTDEATGRKRGMGERVLSSTGRGLGALIYSGDAMGRGGFGGLVGQLAGEEVMGRSGGKVGRKLDEFAAKIKNRRGEQK